MIEVNNVFKSFALPEYRNNTIIGDMKRLILKNQYLNNKFWVLKNIKFTANKGEFIGIIGENGSGKTTLLKVIAGILKPDTGIVKTKGKISSFLELGIGFQGDLSVIENIYLHSSIIGVNKENINSKVRDILEFSGLNNFVNMKVMNLSTGMRARLGFSIAINTDPDILLIDEVLTVGDIVFQKKCLNKLKSFREQNKTVLFVSHDMGVIRKFCDKVILLKNGKQLKFDTPNKVIRIYLRSIGEKNNAGIYDFLKLKEKMLILKRENELKDAYISNILREKKEKFRIKEKRWGTKEVEIENVKFYKKSKETKSFKTDEAMVIRIFYKTKKRIKNPIFGVSVFFENGIECYSTNTLLKKVKIKEISNTGFVDLNIESLPFKKGRFFVSASIHDKDDIHYSWHDKNYYFDIISSGNKNGLLNLNSKWSFSNGGRN